MKVFRPHLLTVCLQIPTIRPSSGGNISASQRADRALSIILALLYERKSTECPLQQTDRWMTLLFVDLIRSFRIRKKPNEVGRVKSVKAKQPAGSKENIYFSSCFFF